MKRVAICCCLAGAVPAMMATPVFSSENGNTQYGLGSSQFYAGAIPPFAGTFAMFQTTQYSADKLKDGNGKDIPAGFKVDVLVETSRLIRVTETKVAGGDLWFQMVAPYVIDQKTQLFGGQDSRGGLADVTLTAGLHWQRGPNSYVFGLDTVAPTGSYDAHRLTNPGLNHWSLQPVLGYHYVDMQQPGWEVGTATRYIVNFENEDTHYRSGQELVVDYAAGYNFNRNLRLGVTGYWLKQLTDDKGSGVADDGNRGQALAFGPSINWRFNTGSELSVSYQKETHVKNRAEGANLWLNFATRF